MFKRSETFFRGHDQTKLFLQTWQKDKSCGTILFTHGQAEHSDCYHRLISGFDTLENGADWNFIGWDLRGHGRSDGLRGYANDFDDFVLDYHLFLQECLKISWVQNKPLILLAHSMGALVQTCGLLSKTYTEFSAQVLSSPMFGVALPVPQWKDSGATFINQFLPKLTLGNEIKNENLTRDLDVIREYEQDTYRHGKISSGVYLGFKREWPRALSRASEITLPTFMHVSDLDPVISSPEAMKFFDALGSANKGLKIVEGGKHELYNDTCRSEVIKAVADFCEQFKK